MVDSTKGSLTGYVDGTRVSRVHNMAALGVGGGAHALNGELATFAHDNITEQNGADPTLSDYYLRSVTVHARALKPKHISAEVAVLRALIIEDAIAEQPAYMQAPIAAAHAQTPFANTDDFLAKVAEVKRGAMQRVKTLWIALLRSRAPSHADAVDDIELDAMLYALEDWDLPLCRSWRPPFDDEADVMIHAAAETEHAGTLLCVAAHAGAIELVHRLIAVGAPVNRIGTSGSPLHAAIATRQLEVVRALLSAGASAEATDCKGRSVLYSACEVGFTEAASLLVSVGDADPHREGCANGESPIALLRRGGSASTEAETVAADLEALFERGAARSSNSMAVDETGKGASTSADKEGAESEEDDDIELPQHDFHTPLDAEHAAGKDEEDDEAIFEEGVADEMMGDDDRDEGAPVRATAPKKRALVERPQEQLACDHMSDGDESDSEDEGFY